MNNGAHIMSRKHYHNNFNQNDNMKQILTPEDQQSSRRYA